jgi:hypothetical protein
MPLPSQPVTLSVEQIAEINRKLAALRHDVNNHLTKIVAAIELTRLNSESAARRWDEAAGEPVKIAERLTQFSRELEALLGITRP